MNGDWLRMWKKAVVTYVQMLFRYSFGEIEVSTEALTIVVNLY
jgi:hypothetical protein